METSLSLSAQLYMLSIHPKKGGIISASYGAMSYVLAGAMLLEMHKNGNVKFENKRVVFANAKSNDAIHRFLLEKIRATRSPKRIGTWISRFTFWDRRIKRNVQSGLSKRRVIRMQEKRFLFIKWKSPIIQNKSLVYNLVDELKECIAHGEAGEDQLVLLSLILPGKLQHRLYSDRKQRREASKKLKKILKENPVSKSVQEAINAAQAVAASVAVSTAVSSS